MGPGDRHKSESAMVKACPFCGKECRVYKCECDGRKHDPTDMPRVVAERLKALHRIAFPPRRLTASPSGITVWVEEDMVRLLPGVLARNDEASTKDGWIVLTPEKWGTLRDCVDRYLAAFDDPPSTEETSS